MRASQNAIGTGVLGGMISATVLAIFFVPAFFVFAVLWLPRTKRAEHGHHVLAGQAGGRVSRARLSPRFTKKDAPAESTGASFIWERTAMISACASH